MTNLGTGQGPVGPLQTAPGPRHASLVAPHPQAPCTCWCRPVASRETPATRSRRPGTRKTLLSSTIAQSQVRPHWQAWGAGRSFIGTRP